MLLYYFVSLQVFGPFTMSFVVSVWLCFPPKDTLSVPPLQVRNVQEVRHS